MSTQYIWKYLLDRMRLVKNQAQIISSILISLGFIDFVPIFPVVRQDGLCPFQNLNN